MVEVLKKRVSNFLVDFWNDKNSDEVTLHSDIFSDELHVYSPLGNSIWRKYIQDVNSNWFSGFPDLELSDISIQVEKSLKVLSSALEQKDRIALYRLATA